MAVGKVASKKIIGLAQKMVDREDLDESSEKWKGKKLTLQTSWEDCFIILGKGYEIGVVTELDRTFLRLYKDNEIVSDVEVSNTDAYAGEGSWQWNYIYKHFCTVLTGKKKKQKADELTVLRKRRNSLRQRINYAKKKGNPTKDLEQELNEILKQIKS